MNFAGTLRALQRRFGDDLASRAIARVPGEAGATIREDRIEATEWYPVAWYDALLAAIEHELPREEHVCRDLSRDAVAHDLATIFRALSFVVSPDFALVNAMRVVSLYWDGGRISVVRADAASLHFRFEGFDGLTPRCWEDFVGGVEAVIDSLRLTRLPTHVVLDPTDSSRCEIVIRYRM